LASIQRRQPLGSTNGFGPLGFAVSFLAFVSRSKKPACAAKKNWHGSPRNAVHEYVGAANAAACLTVQRAQLGLVAHTHQAAAWQQTPTGARRARIGPGEPLYISTGRWLLNPGAVGAPAPSRLRWWDALDVQAADGAFWLLLDLKGRTATWRRAPYEPAPARSRARALGLDDGYATSRGSEVRHSSASLKNRLQTPDDRPLRSGQRA